MLRQELTEIPYEVLKLIILLADDQAIVKLLLSNKWFNKTIKELLYSGEHKSHFNFFSVRASYPASLISHHYTSFTLGDDNCLFTGSNKGFVKLINQENQTVIEKEIYKGKIFNDSVIAVNRLDVNTWITLSDKGMVKVFHLQDGELKQLAEKQLELNSLKPDWTVSLDNGHLAILTVNKSDRFQIDFVAVENNEIVVTTVMSRHDFRTQPDRAYNIDKIHPGHGDSVYAVVYLKNNPQSVARFIAQFSIKDEWEEAPFELNLIGEEEEECQYGQSIASTFALLVDEKSKKPILIGFDLVRFSGKFEKRFYLNRLCDSEDSTFRNDDLSYLYEPSNTSQNDKFDTHTIPFLQILPNQCLFVREKDKFVIYQFELSHHKKNQRDMFEITNLKMLCFYKIPKKHEKVVVSGVQMTNKGNLAINCSGFICEWYLKTNELVVKKMKQSDEFMLEDKNPVLKM